MTTLHNLLIVAPISTKLAKKKIPKFSKTLRRYLTSHTMLSSTLYLKTPKFGVDISTTLQH